MIVLLDCDGVLLDWEQSFREWVVRRLRKPIAAQPTDWDLSKWLGVSPQVAKLLIHDFNHSASFGRLMPVSGAVRQIEMLHQLGCEMHVITSCSRAESVVSMRYDNLRRHFGDVFSSVACLDLGETKAHALVEHGPGCIWIEDNYNGALIGKHLGHRTYMLRWPHNKQWDKQPDQYGVVWCDNWAQIGGHLQEPFPTAAPQYSR